MASSRAVPKAVLRWIRANEYAKGISTGSNTGGYSLTSVELDVDTVPNSTTDLVVQIWSSTGDDAPDSAVITLDIPTTLSEGLNTFPAPEDSVLNASTIYFLVVSYTGGSPHLGMPPNSTGALDDTGLAGWDWENGYARPRGSTDAWTGSSSGQRMRMRFNGTAVGGTPSTDATLSGLSLGTGVTLDPTFAPGTTSYTAAVGNAVDEVTVTATLGDSGYNQCSRDHYRSYGVHENPSTGRVEGGNPRFRT